MAAPKRPLSPFMIGPYYRPQLTSVLSILHRATGVALAIGAFGLVAWLLAVAGEGTRFMQFQSALASPLGMFLVAAFVLSLSYHFLNGIRHLLWDIGWGYELPRAYATGYVVVALTFIVSAAILYAGLVAGGDA